MRREACASMAFLDPKRFRTSLSPQPAALGAIGAFGASVRRWRQTAEARPEGPGWGSVAGGLRSRPRLTLAASICGAPSVLWGAYRALAKKSKLLRVERFDLRVRTADELLGRDEDVSSLKALIEGSSLRACRRRVRLREILARRFRSRSRDCEGSTVRNSLFSLVPTEVTRIRD